MSYLYLKALHIIFIVTWFAGLFYIIRLFIYQTEANQKPEPDRSILVDQLKLMSSRLWYIITWPSAILTQILGFWLLFTVYGFHIPGWLWIKLILITLLFGYQLYSHIIFKKLQRDEYKFSGQWLRFYNEVATLLLFAIVFIVILKQALPALWGIVGIIGLALVLTIATKWYKRYRIRNENK